MIRIRRSHDSLIFITEIPIPWKTLRIEAGLRFGSSIVPQANTTLMLQRIATDGSINASSDLINVFVSWMALWTGGQPWATCPQIFNYDHAVQAAPAHFLVMRLSILIARRMWGQVLQRHQGISSISLDLRIRPCWTCFVTCNEIINSYSLMHVRVKFYKANRASAVSTKISGLGGMLDMFVSVVQCVFSQYNEWVFNSMVPENEKCNHLFRKCCLKCTNSDFKLEVYCTGLFQNIIVFDITMWYLTHWFLEKLMDSWKISLECIELNFGLW